MSLINQVLNQLEQRGARMAAEQTMVQAVPPIRHKSAMPLLALGLALAGGVGAWQWLYVRMPDVAAENIAPKTGNSPNSHAPEKLAASGQPAVAMVTPASDVPVASGVAKLPPAASQLSFELSAASPPSAIQQDSGQAASTSSKQGTSAGSRQALRGEKALALADTAAPARQPTKNPDKPALTQSTAPEAKANVQPDTRPNVQALGGAMPMKLISPAQQAEAEFRKAIVLMQQGRVADAVAGYEAALRLDAGHDAARQALVALLLEQKRGADAERVLQERLKSNPEHSGFAMLLARFQVERGALEQAVATLERSLPYAGTQADYQAFFAALLQRQSRHKEAIEHYRIALQLVPDKGIWLMGYGISLQAVQRNDDAGESFRRAIDSKTLSPELHAFVQQKLKEL